MLVVPTRATEPTSSMMVPEGIGRVKLIFSVDTVTSRLWQNRVAVINDTSSIHANAVPPNSVAWWLIVVGKTTLATVVTERAFFCSISVSNAFCIAFPLHPVNIISALIMPHPVRDSQWNDQKVLPTHGCLAG